MSTINSTLFSDTEEHEQETEINTGSILSFYPKEDDIDVEDIPEVIILYETRVHYKWETDFIKYENTYRMETLKPFNEHKAMNIVNNEIETFLKQETKYNPYEVANICAAMSRSIRNNIVNKMDFERYKIVCIVEIVEKKSQGVFSTVRFLRDIKADQFVRSKFENNNLFAAIVVAAIYYE